MKIVIAIACLIASASMYGQDNFTGNWKLNTEKSDFANVDPSTAAASNLVVEQDKGTITYQKDGNPKRSYKIDSTAEIEIVNPNSKVKMSFKPAPDKKGLVEIRNYNYPDGQQGIEQQRIRTWILSDDKKTLTILDHVEATNGNIYDMVLIYERQG